MNDRVNDTTHIHKEDKKDRTKRDKLIKVTLFYNIPPHLQITCPHVMVFNERQ